jgi:flagellar protein FlbD
MILLTRLNNKSLTVNSDLIKFVEQSPDTIVTLITGEKIVVRESVDQILVLIVEFRRLVLRGLPISWDSSSLHRPPASPRNSEPESGS